MAKLILKGARVIDPANGVDRVTSVFIDGTKVAAIGRRPEGFKEEQSFELKGKILTPGFIELSARLGEPGHEHRSTIASEARAAVASGFTSICCMPDTTPVVDNAAVVEHIRQRASRARAAKVLCLGALTQGLDGDVLAEMYALKESGCVAVTNADRAIRDTSVLRNALAYAATSELTVLLRPLEHWLTREGAMHEGAISTMLGIPGISEAQELIAISRDLILIEETGARAHFCCLSSARSIALVERARRAGLNVSADVALANLTYTDTDVGSYDANFHVHPPLRTSADRKRLRQAIDRQQIEAICANHFPHDADAKATPFSQSAPGMSMFDAFLPNLLALVESGAIGLANAIAAVTTAPSQILQLEAGTLGVGAPADICVFDPNLEWQMDEQSMLSAGKNSPSLGHALRGKVHLTLIDGRVVHKLDD